jgi:hypothetical protein
VELSPVVARLQRELLAVAAAGGEEVRAVAERLVAPLDPAVRLVIIEVLAEALDAVTREIAPGSAHLRLRGRDPDIVVTPPPVRAETANQSVPEQHREGAAEDLTEGPVSRINFRPPESLKVRIEQAAARERLSVNAWLVRATSAAIDAHPDRPSTSTRNHFSGWVG